MITQAFANPHVITRIGTAPLFGPIDSTQALQRAVADHERLFADAATQIGLTQSEYATVRERIRTSQMTYGRLPRHLDAMSWASAGRVYAVHDVIIPADTHGWKMTLREPNARVGVYIPNGCGNISMVRQPAPPVTPPTRTPAPPVTPPTAPPPAVTPTPGPTPTATSTVSPYFYTPTPSAPPPSSHHFPWFLLLPIIALIGGGGHGSISTAPFGPPNGGPTPPVICPTPTPHH